MTRRRVLSITTVTALALGGGAWLVDTQPWQDHGAATLVRPSDPEVDHTEAARHVDGAGLRQVRLVAEPATIDLGGRRVQTWTFNKTVPGPQITLRAGDRLRAEVVNRLPAPLTVHWHGIAIRNDMDGVPDLTQAAIKPGRTFTYTFTAATAGTYFYHSHVGAQLDRGLYGALIVLPRQTAATQPTRDVTVLLDDWIDGTGRTPDDVYAQLSRGTGTGTPMPGMGMSGDSGMDGMPMTPTPPMTGPTASAASPLGTDTADLDYPLYLINGRSTAMPDEIAVPAGRQARLRLINAGSATPFRVAVSGRRLTVIATDGYPVDPVTVDALIIGMGERYDVLVTTPTRGNIALVAVAEGRSGQARAILRSGAGPDPTPTTQPAQLSGRLLTLSDLHATRADALRPRSPSATDQVALTGSMTSYRWGITTGVGDGKSVPVRHGQRIRLVIANHTMMWHPIHLHGHTFQVVTTQGNGPRKDTIIVPPMGTVTIDFDADNPGQWRLHCHNVYHAEAGMTAIVRYYS